MDNCPSMCNETPQIASEAFFLGKGVPGMLKIRYRRRNYCTAAPDWLPLIGNMGKVCRRHDRQYAIGGTKTLRKAVDIKFRMELRLLATRRRLPPSRLPWLRKAWGYLVAEMYYRAVRAFGGRFWGQK